MAKYTYLPLLDHDCVKNYCRLEAVDLSIQRELDADAKTILRVDFVEQLKRQIAKVM